MDIRTLIIGFTPIADTAGKKPRQLRDDAFYKELLAQFDLGELHFAGFNDWKAKSDEVNPLFIVILGNDYYGHEVKAYKNDALLYATFDAGQIFYRKAEAEEKRKKQYEVFAEVELHVKKMREGGEKEIELLRKFAALSFDDLYKIFIKAIIGDDEKLRKEAWDLLMTKNGHPDLLWMRLKLICETWEHADGKGKEEFLCMAMDQEIEEGLACKMEDFIEDEQIYHQYMFRYYDGSETNYIRRIPYGTKGQDKYAYEAILKKYETPIGPRMLMEAGQMRSAKEEWAKEQCAKFIPMLKVWKEDPKKPMKELGVKPWYPYTENDPLVGRELEGFKDFLKKHDPENYKVIF